MPIDMHIGTRSVTLIPSPLAPSCLMPSLPPLSSRVPCSFASRSALLPRDRQPPEPKVTWRMNRSGRFARPRRKEKNGCWSKSPPNRAGRSLERLSDHPQLSPDTGLFRPQGCLRQDLAELGHLGCGGATRSQARPEQPSSEASLN